MNTQCTRPSARRAGFTLVEILIVVIILGILAAIVIPQFTNASTDARKASLVSQLQTLRSQIQLFKLQHNDVLPDLVANQWAQMMSKTDLTGAVNTAAAGIYGPYLESTPKNPLNGDTTVAAAPGAVVDREVADDGQRKCREGGVGAECGVGRVRGLDPVVVGRVRLQALDGR